ncbi:MAG TPA: metalloregulator ArsR/SmtB family transcription factor [Saprospiraceae bacterium]|nr:metalloregulator ArsR/SmtB family transcription factor [Saprospiraceae bacterium]
MEFRRDVFQAVSDPTRRQILEILSGRTLNLNALAAYFDISRPAISKQVKILEQCGLIDIEDHGRERYCRYKEGTLDELTRWVETLKELDKKGEASPTGYLQWLKTKKMEEGEEADRLKVY